MSKKGFLHIQLSNDTLEKAQKHLKDFSDAPPSLEVREVVIQYRGQEVDMTMAEFIEAVGLELPCQTCNGTGEVSKMAPVYPGEPHMADVDTGPCPDCQGKENDHE